MNFITNIRYRNYYKFRARIYNIPSSFNRVGIDPYPKYFLRPTDLLEVMAYSNSPKSTEDGFLKDKESGLYLKNRKEIGDAVEPSEVEAQFEFIKVSPPYWWRDESTYFEFIQTNFENKYSENLSKLYVANHNPAISVEQGEDEDITAEHVYKELTTWTTKSFNKQVDKSWPIEKGVTITKMKI